MEEIDDSLSHIPALSGAMQHKRAWEMYVGYLHGRPMWTRSQEHSAEDDFFYLVQIWDFAEFDCEDADVMDAAMDAIRELVLQDGQALRNPFNVLENCCIYEFDRNLLGAFLMDYMLYGNFDGVFKKWYNGNGPCADETLNDGLSCILGQTAGAKNKHEPVEGGQKRDLMGRCSYHTHVQLGKPCYLDK